MTPLLAFGRWCSTDPNCHMADSAFIVSLRRSITCGIGRFAAFLTAAGTIEIGLVVRPYRRARAPARGGDVIAKTAPPARAIRRIHRLFLSVTLHYESSGTTQGCALLPRSGAPFRGAGPIRPSTRIRGNASAPPRLIRAPNRLNSDNSANSPRGI